ncbi:MAG: cytochrome P450 [Dehalococcoidia bacterium]|nr:cytochrome P450 [Dehalococcoidia bacterium]
MAFFNPFRPSYVQDPYPALKRLREEEPVFQWREQDGWVITRHEDCSRVLRDSDAFSSDPSKARGGLGQYVARGRAQSPLAGAPLIGSVDGPVHTRLRAIVNRAFTPRVIEGEREFIKETAAALLDAGGDPLDVARQVTHTLPVTVISDLLGLAPEERNPVRDWANTLMGVHSDPDATPQARRAAALAAERFRAFLAQYRDHHGPEYDSRLFTILVEAESAGDRLSPEELLAFAVFLYTAGSGPTAMMLANVIAHLAQHPEALEAVRADRSLLRPAIEESLRFDSATHVLLRYCVQETQVDGHTIRPGETVYVMVASAHRDPEVFEDPDRFDVTRQIAGGRLLSYGAGPHFCLGAPLAYLQGEELLDALLDRFSSLDIVRGGLQMGGTFLLRGPERLVITGR